MSLSSLITGYKPFRTLLRDKDQKADLLLIDVTTKIEPQYEAETTDNPVEEGPDITDGIRVKPLRITVTGEMSETPLNLKAELAGLVTSAGAFAGARFIGGFGATAGAVIGGAIGSSLLMSSDNPAKVARDKLEEIISKKILFTLVDKYRKYENMTMTALSFPSEQKNSGKLAFTFSAKQLTIVSSELTQIEKLHKSVAHSAAGHKKDGTQSGEESKDSNGSILFKALKGLGG